MITVPRARLLRVLRQRHRLSLVALEAPGGSGRTVLLDHALAEGSPDGDDVRVDCRAPDAAPGALAARCLDALGAPPRPPDELSDPVTAATAVAEAMTARQRDVALVLDAAERAGDAGAQLLAQLVHLLPRRGHLVVSGRRLPGLAVPARVAAGRAAALGPDDLALRSDEVRELAARVGVTPPGDRELLTWPAVAQLVLTDPELVPRYLHDLATTSADPAVLRAALVIASVGGAERRVAEQILAATVPDAAGREAEIRDLPLIRVRAEGIWPHPIWATVAEDALGTDLRRRARAALGRARLDQGALIEAGRIAVEAGDAAVLADVARAALATLPARAPVAELERWASAPVLPAGSIERRWLRAVIDRQWEQGPAPSGGIDALEEVRAELEADGDLAAEMAVLLHIGGRARRDGDLATLARCLARGDTLDGAGAEAARPLASLGRAIARQFAGDPAGAVAELARLAPRHLQGDLGAQLLMVRGTNLLLCGRTAEAVRALEAATGLGADASRAVAYDLLGTAQWAEGDTTRAVANARTAVDLAAGAGAPAIAEAARAALGCYLALADDPDVDAVLAELPADSAAGADGEPGELRAVAVAAHHVHQGDLASAAAVLAGRPPAVGRPLRSTLWRAGMETALVPAPVTDWAALAAVHQPIRAAVTAGRAAADHLAGGPPAASVHHPHLPAAWCDGATIPVDIRLIGPATVRRGHRPVETAEWRRGRVRELCLHLAMRSDATRRQVAAALWPDLDEEGGRANLRVNLTHLMAVLDPGRPRGQRSPLLVDDPSMLALADRPELRVDLRDLDAAARQVLEAARTGDHTAVLGAARRLLAVGDGPVLGGVEIGEWFVDVRRRLDEVVLRAVAAAGPVALDTNLPELAEALGRRAVRVDAWTESAHRLVIGARLHVGDADGARRAAIDALIALDEVGGARDPRTLELAHRSGLRPPWPTRRAGTPPG